MALKRRKSPKPRKPRPNQFGVTLGVAHATLLRAEAARLDVKETTLAKQLLEQALADREAPAGDGGDVLSELRAELHALRVAHHNSTLKLLLQSGMSVDAVTAWAKEHLKK